MRLTERQLRLAVREMILREGFIDKLLDFLSGDRKKSAKMSGENISGFGKHDKGYRYPMVADYLSQENSPGQDGTDEEWKEYIEQEEATLKKNSKYVKNLVKELQGILGEARRR